MSKTNINIKLFGQIVDIIGSNSIQVNDVENTNELIQKLQKNYPLLLNIKYAVAVDKKVIQSNTLLQPNAEIALLPPFSGG